MSVFLEYTACRKDSGGTFEEISTRHLGVSSGLLKELKYAKKIFINGIPCRSVDKVYESDKISLDVSEKIEKCEIEKPFKYDLDILYEDDFFIVVNKPGEMECHPCHSNYTSTLANCLAYYWLKKGEYHKCHIVNRLDRGTSGICVVAKNRFAHGRLSFAMKNKTFQKYYTAIVHGDITPDCGVIDLPIGRSDDSIIKRNVQEDGKRAVTLYEKIGAVNDYSVVNIKLETGRTHQIRVHFSHINHPLVGDWLYGNGDKEKELISRQALHCQRISFPHPATNENMEFTLDLPEDMKSLLKTF